MRLNKIIVITAVLSLFLAGCNAEQANRYSVFVPNASEGTITVYDTESEEVVNTIVVGDTASHGIAVTPNGQHIYAGDLDGGNIYVINADAGEKIKTIEVGERTHGIDISPDGKYVLVAAGRSGGPILAVIDTESNKIVKVISERLAGPTHMSFAPDGRLAYIADPVANKVIVVDMKVLEVTAAWDTLSSGPQEIAVSPDGRRIYVANYEGGTVTVISTQQATADKNIVTGPNTHAVAVSPDNGHLWVVADNQVKIIDTTNNYQIVYTIRSFAKPNHVAFAPQGEEVYVTDSKDNKAYVFDAKSFEPITSFDVGETPHEIDFSLVKER